MEKLMNWLASSKDTAFCDQGHGEVYSRDYNYVIVRTKRDENFDFLFCQKNWRGKNPTDIIQPEPLSYAGAYFKSDGKIYDAQDILIDYVSDSAVLRELTMEKLLERIQQEVREKVESIIGNDRSNLRVVELADAHLRRELQEKREFGAKSAARLRFLEETPQPIQFHCGYRVIAPEVNRRDSNLIKNETMFAYLRDPDGYVNQEASKYIRENQEKMLFTFLNNDLLQKEYDSLVSDADDQIHVVRKIMTAMQKEPLAKTVNVTIRKNGKMFTFKANAEQFRMDCSYVYNKNDIVSQDRQEFKFAFGYNASYRPKDIVQITYGRKVLYENISSASEEPIL